MVYCSLPELNNVLMSFAISIVQTNFVVLPSKLPASTVHIKAFQTKEVKCLTYSTFRL